MEGPPRGVHLFWDRSYVTERDPHLGGRYGGPLQCSVEQGLPLDYGWRFVFTAILVTFPARPLGDAPVSTF